MGDWRTWCRRGVTGCALLSVCAASTAFARPARFPGLMLIDPRAAMSSETDALTPSPTTSHAPSPIPSPISSHTPTATPSSSPSPRASGGTAQTPAECPLPPMRAIHTCENMGDGLCIETPSGGTTAEKITIRGVVALRTHGVAGVHMVAQHDATKMLLNFPGEIPLDADGRFAVTVPLAQYGSYTITVQALRIGADPLLASVTTSRVVAPNVADAALSLDPSISAGTPLTTSSVNLQLDLLPKCEHCDAIGSTTGGTTVIVTDVITAPDGSERRVVRTTDVGADGQYRMCVPVVAGHNQLSVRACNAANRATDGACADAPRTLAFDVVDTVPTITMLAPAASDVIILDARERAPLAVQFRVTGALVATTNISSTANQPSTTVSSASEGCTAPVCVAWNHEPERNASAGTDGVYTITATPQTGVNVLTIRATGKSGSTSRTVTMGWGSLQSPWNTSRELQSLEKLWQGNAVSLGVRKAFIADTVRALLNHAFASDRVGDVITTLTDPPPTKSAGAPDANVSEAAAMRATALAKIRASLGAFCAVDPHAPTMRVQLAEAPHIGKIDIARVEYSQDQVKLTIVINDLKLLLRYFRDNDDDGQPDLKVMPLKIAFKTLVLSPVIRLQRGAEPTVLLTADTTDCDYQSSTYCTKRPALVLPQNYVGGLSDFGAFVMCDTDEQAIAPDDRAGCEGLNIVNAQTGLLSEQILNALNTALYCTGTSQLTYLLRDGISFATLSAGCDGAPTAANAGERTSSNGLPPAVAATDASAMINLCGADPATSPFRGRSYSLPFGFDLVRSTFALNESGMRAVVSSRVGTTAWYANAFAPTVQQPQVGYYVDPETLHLPEDSGLSGARDVDLNVGEALINQLLFALTMQGDPGMLDWDIHQLFYAHLGFDAVHECDAPKISASGGSAGDQSTAGGACVVASDPAKKSGLCDLRPRVNEFLGTSLSEAGYFSSKQPLMIRVRGSRTLAPHVRFETADIASVVGNNGQPQHTRHAQLVILQIPDLEVGYYALRIDPAHGVDQYGNPALMLDSRGSPVVLSLRPEQSDPLAGAIIRARANIQIALEMGKLEIDPCDPSRFMLPVRVNPDRTKVRFSEIAGSNATILSADALLSTFEQKIQIALGEYGKEGAQPLKIPLPKRLALGTMFAGQWWNDLLGLQELRLVGDQLDLGVDPGQDFLSISTDFNFLQRLPIAGTMQEWNVPEE